MAVVVALETIIGVVELRSVGLGRASAWIPSRGRSIYLVHALSGGVLGLLSIAVLIAKRDRGRLERLGSVIGLIGVGIAALGGMLAMYHSVRLIGMALMFVGAGTAFFSYLIPLGRPATLSRLPHS